MPYSKRKRTTRRRPKRRTARRQRKGRMTRPLPVILPNRYTCRLKYVSEFQLNPGTAGIASQVYRANCCYDPDSTGSGHQPMGFDQLCLMFNQFTVLGSKITVRATESTAGSLLGMHWGIMLTDSGTRTAAMSGIEQILEQEGGKKRSRQTFGAYGGNALITPHNSMCTKTFSLRKFFNIKDTTGREYQCTSAATPTEMAYFEVWGCSVYGNDPSSHSFIAELEFIVQCHEPKTLSQS